MDVERKLMDTSGETVQQSEGGFGVVAEKTRVLENDTDYMQVKDLKKFFKTETGETIHAVDGITFGVKKGEIFGLLGPNGAGKTTAINVITGLYQATKGKVRICGYDIELQADKAYEHLGVCPQEDIYWDDLNAPEILSFFARLRGLKGARRRHNISEMIEKIGLGSEKSKLIKNYSGGMKRRLSVACAFIGDNDLVILDEPSSGLDLSSRAKMWSIIRQIKKKTAVILTTHSLEEADTMCDRIAIMAKGVIRTVGTPQGLKNHFGKGYKLTVTLEGRSSVYEGDFANFLKQNRDGLFRDVVIEYQLNGIFVCKVNISFEEVPDLIRELRNNSKTLHIEDWGISQSSLDQIFFDVVKD